jgi:arylsulfatase A-like enzyme
VGPLVYDNHPVDQPRSPDEGYHFTDDITDKALEFIKDAKAIAPDKPFFLYYAPGAAHAPHHVSREWIERYARKFDMGYEAIREQTLARQKEIGIVPADTELPPLNPIGTPQTRTGPDGQPFPPLDYTKPWDSLSTDQPGYFELAGEGLCVGRDSGAAVTDDYPGERPYRFTGGVIKRVVVDVSGTPYVDLERQAAAMLARE